MATIWEYAASLLSYWYSCFQVLTDSHYPCCRAAQRRLQACISN